MPRSVMSRLHWFLAGFLQDVPPACHPVNNLDKTCVLLPVLEPQKGVLYSETF